MVRLRLGLAAVVCTGLATAVLSPDVRLDHGFAVVAPNTLPAAVWLRSTPAASLVDSAA